MLETLVKSAMALCDAHTGAIYQKCGDLFHMTADAAYSAEVSAYSRAHPLAPGMDSNVGRTALTGKVVQIPDVLADPDYKAFEYQRVARYHPEIKLTI